MYNVYALMDFIKRSPTAFHAVENIRRMFEENGFRALNECEPWQIVPGQRYYVTRNQSSIIAFRVPEGRFDHFQIVASHSDSPSFKLKPAARRENEGYALLNVEKYGGSIMYTWFDRPLSIAGRAIVSTENGLEARLVNLDRNLALIPSLPIHFNREVNDGVKLNPQVDMMPVYGEAGASCLALVAEALGVEKEKIAACEMYLVNRDAPALWGRDGEFISAPRLDDLECAYTSARALIDAEPSRHVDVMCVFDNEEVGSGTKQGANSDFLALTLRRVVSALGNGDQAFETALARSMLVSADNAHAIHPNHPEKYDHENRVTMNGGVVVKFNASQSYASDGVSQAIFEAICNSANVPVQRFANRSDIPGGSTLGNFANRHASMITVDVGLAQLAMHSANECAGTRDVDFMIDALRRFHETEIGIVGDGRVTLRYGGTPSEKSGQND